ncbi:MAG: DegT/DnrJ/EryC1/StrS family aminotransferase, partial [bacterium]
GKVKAILPVHVAGQPCRMDAIVDIAQRFDLRIVEDAAHALEAEIGLRLSAGGEERSVWRKVGTIGDATCFSFYATKNITTGEGGMVTTHNTKLAERIRCLALHGLSRDAWKRYSGEGDWYYEIVEQGYKYNMPDILAALGLSQLQRVEQMHQTRCHLVGIYEKELQDIPEVILPRTHGNVKHAWHLYIMRLQTNLLTITRNKFVVRLKEAGIGTSVHFIPLHLHPYYQRRFGCKPGDHPVAERLYRSAISLPLYPKLTEEQVHFVAAKVKQLIKENSKQTKFKGVDPRTFHSANFNEKAS